VNKERGNELLNKKNILLVSEFQNKNLLKIIVYFVEIYFINLLILEPNTLFVIKISNKELAIKECNPKDIN
jgi:hypothetical protein